MILPKPEFKRSKPRLPSNSPADTPEDLAKQVTHKPGDLPSLLDRLVPKDSMLRNRIIAQRRQQQASRRSFASDALKI